MWILEGAKEAGLYVHVGSDAEIFKLRPNALSPLKNTAGTKPSLISKISSRVINIFGKIDRDGPKTLHEVSHTTLVRYHASPEYLPETVRYFPKSLKNVAVKLNEQTSPFSAVAYKSLFENTKQDTLGENEQKMVKVQNDKFVVHTAKKGESLSGISKSYTGTYDNWPTIREINKAAIPNPNLIYVGQRILIPVDLIDWSLSLETT